LILLRLLFDPFGDSDPGSLIYASCLFLVALSIWSLWSWQRLTKSLFDPYVLYFVAAVLFNGGQALLEVFHLNEGGILDGRFSSETTLETLFLVILGLASFHFGALLAAAASSKIALKQTGKRIALLPAMQDIRRVGWGLLLISFVPTLFVLRGAVSIVMSSGYFGLFEATYGTGFSAGPQVLAGFLVPAALFLLAGSRGRRIGILVSGIVIVSYAVIQFFLGSRAKAAMPLIAYAWLWHHSIRPLPKTVLLSLGAVMLLIVFPLVGAIRNVSGEERFSFGFLSDAFLSIDNPTIAIISEMGGSMATVAYTLDLVPSFRDFDKGVGYLYALLTAIPNLFWDVHPTVARGLPSNWLIWTVNPFIADLGGGYGFTFIAEAYFNFGWFGAPIALGVIGFLLGKLTLWAARSGEPAKMAMIAAFLSYVLFFARQEAAAQVRSLLWYSLVPYLGVYAIASLRSRSYGKNSDLLNSSGRPCYSLNSRHERTPEAQQR